MLSGLQVVETTHTTSSANCRYRMHYINAKLLKQIVNVKFLGLRECSLHGYDFVTGSKL